jgi:hypothetical protein
MEDTGVIKLYEPSPTPCLYVAPVGNMVGRVPLVPWFLAGNSTPTIPHKFSKYKGSGFPMGCANKAAADGRHGSNVYEVSVAISIWALQATPGWSDSWGDCPEEGHCALGTRKACSGDSSFSESRYSRIQMKSVCGWCLYQYVPVHTSMYQYALELPEFSIFWNLTSYYRIMIPCIGPVHCCIGAVNCYI